MLLVLLVVLGGLLLGFFNGLLYGGIAHPRCGQLPRKAQVVEAIAAHNDLVDQLTATGDGVDVTVSTPCSHPDQAVVAVRVTTADEEASVREVLGHSEGFGVPAVVERR